MAFNPMNLMKIKKQWEQFNAAHPRFVPYLKALKNGYLDEGTVIEMNVTAPDGRSLKCNIRLSAEDMELMRQISELS